ALVGEPAPLQKILDGFRDEYVTRYQAMMRSKIGLATAQAQDEELVADLDELLQAAETDMTIFFRLLAQVSAADDSPNEALAILKPAFYDTDGLGELLASRWMEWFERYFNRLGREDRSDSERAAAMNAVNPKYVLRNYMAQLAIDKADAGDYALIDELHQLLKHPYAEQPDQEKWFAKRPEWARHKVGCSMLSCSS
ncbi:MAG: protein adenylyltransferase SelO family protein, partial [Bacteroidota bacterium]